MVAREFVELVAMEDAKLGLTDRADAIRAFLPERPPDEVRGKDDADDLLAAVGGGGDELQYRMIPLAPSIAPRMRSPGGRTISP